MKLIDFLLLKLKNYSDIDNVKRFSVFIDEVIDKYGTKSIMPNLTYGLADSKHFGIVCLNKDIISIFKRHFPEAKEFVGERMLIAYHKQPKYYDGKKSMAFYLTKTAPSIWIEYHE